MSRLCRRTSGALAVLFLFMGALGSPSGAFAYDRREGVVRWVIDGDTFVLSSGERVRLLGVNAPENEPWKNKVEPYGREAAQYAKKMLTGEKVYLEGDLEEKDKYGRTLAYVFLADGVFINERLVAEGLARARYYAPNGRYRVILRRAEEEAKKSGKGLWALATRQF